MVLKHPNQGLNLFLFPTAHFVVSGLPRDISHPLIVGYSVIALTPQVAGNLPREALVAKRKSIN